jgi:hypothetical protein
MSTKRRHANITPLKLDVVEMRKKLTLLKLGKLITSDKRGKKR